TSWAPEDRPMDPLFHPDEGVLAALFTGRLSGDDLETVAAHLDECPACQEKVDAFRPQADPVLAALWRPGAAPAAEVRYREVCLHAKGGLGEVFVAHDEELHRQVAVKRLHRERAGDAASRRRFVQEAEITGRLEHPGVVPVYGLAAADGRPGYAMRFIQGETLHDALKRFHAADRPGRDPGERGLALRQLLHQFQAVCHTVAYAHSRGIVHRDLKPQNIMLGKYGETLVVDWGLAKAFARDDSARASGEETLAPT